MGTLGGLFMKVIFQTQKGRKREEKDVYDLQAAMYLTGCKTHSLFLTRFTHFSFTLLLEQYGAPLLLIVAPL